MRGGADFRKPLGNQIQNKRKWKQFFMNGCNTDMLISERNEGFQIKFLSNFFKLDCIINNWYIRGKNKLHFTF
jgi:hypothetical protein